MRRQLSQGYGVPASAGKSAELHIVSPHFRLDHAESVAFKLGGARVGDEARGDVIRDTEPLT